MHAEEPPSAPELDAVVAAAEQQLRALASEDPLDAGPLAEALADAATAAIASGQPIADIARAEQRGQQQARTALSRDLLARVERAARRRRDAEHDLHQAVARTARLGLPQREIAAAAGSLPAPSARSWPAPTTTAGCSSPRTTGRRSARASKRNPPRPADPHHALCSDCSSATTDIRRHGVAVRSHDGAVGINRRTGEHRGSSPGWEATVLAEMASRVLRSFLDVFASSERTVPSDHSPNVAAGGCCTTGRLRPAVEHGQLVHRRPLRAPRKASSASIECRSREPQPDGSNVGAGGPDRPRLARSFGQGVARTSPRVLTVTTAPSLTMTHPASRLRLANSIVGPRQHLPPSRLSSGIRGRVTHPAPGEGQLVARLHEIAPGRSRRPRHSTPRT